MKNFSIEKNNYLNYWWLIISFYGFIHFTFNRINYFLYPIGFLIFILGIMTFKFKEKNKKISFGFTISLLLIIGIGHVFNYSTATFFGFLVSTTILLLHSSQEYSPKHAYFSLLIIPGLCDIFAGLNKLIPENKFLHTNLLSNLVKQNLFLEPSFLINNIDIIKNTVPFLEILAGLLIIINPKKSFPFIVLLHLPIAFLTGSNIGQLIQLLTYSGFLFFCIISGIFIKNRYFAYSNCIEIFYSLIHDFQIFINQPLKYLDKKLSPLLILNIFQVILPLIILFIRIFTGIKIFKGFGWQMFS